MSLSECTLSSSPALSPASAAGMAVAASTQSSHLWHLPPSLWRQISERKLIQTDVCTALDITGFLCYIWRHIFGCVSIGSNTITWNQWVIESEETIEFDLFAICHYSPNNPLSVVSPDSLINCHRWTCCTHPNKINWISRPSKVLHKLHMIFSSTILYCRSFVCKSFFIDHVNIKVIQHNLTN